MEDDGDPENRLDNSDWCFCIQCCPVSRVVESLCCEEISALEDKLRTAEDAVEDCSCMTRSLRFCWTCLDSEALDLALLSMVDVRADTLIRPISSTLVVVCENVAPDSFCGNWNTQEPCSAVGMLRSHDNGTPIKVNGDSHEWWLKIAFLLSECLKAAKLTPLPKCVNSRTVGLNTRSRTVLLRHGWYSYSSTGRAQQVMLTSSNSVGQSTLHSLSQDTFIVDDIVFINSWPMLDVVV